MKQHFPLWLAVTVLVVQEVRAQETNTSLGQVMPGEGARVLPTPPLGRMLEGLGAAANILTEAQRNSLVRAAQSRRAQARELEMRLRETRRELLLHALSGRYDEQSAQQKAREIAQFEAELVLFRAKMLSEIEPPLSPEQLRQIRELTRGQRTMGSQGTDQPGRRRILQQGPRDENDLPPKP